MATGLCSTCKIFLTQENCMPIVLRLGYGYCRDCSGIRRREEYRKNPEKYKADSAKFRRDYPDKIKESRVKDREKYHDVRLTQRKTYSRTPDGRHRTLAVALRKDGTPSIDLLWNLHFYRQLILDNKCHYCNGPLNECGHALDRMSSESGHEAWNVVPCCRDCNIIKGKHWEYEHMMLLAPKLRRLRTATPI